jgi:WD40 repeat protein
LLIELQAGKNCIYDIEWLNGRHLACGGGDYQIFVFDVTTSQRISVLTGHKESVRSIARLPNNEHIVASGARDGSLFIFDTRCNRSNETPTSVRAIHSSPKAHFMDTSAANTSRNVLKSKASNFAASSPHHHHHMHLNNLKPSSIAGLAFQNDITLVTAGATDGLIKVLIRFNYLI